MKSLIKKIRYYGLFKSIGLILPVIRREINLKRRRVAFPKYAMEVLIHVSKVLQQHNVEHWLEYGTLLGLVRDGKLIPNDLDLDIGVFTPEQQDAYRIILQRAGFKLIKVWLLENKIVEETYLYKNVHVDLYYFQRSDDKLVAYTFYRDRTLEHGLKINEYKTLRYSYLGYSGTEELVINGANFIIPCGHDFLLRQKYGNWRVRNSAWTIFDSPVVDQISSIATLKVFG